MYLSIFLLQYSHCTIKAIKSQNCCLRQAISSDSQNSNDLSCGTIEHSLVQYAVKLAVNTSIQTLMITCYVCDIKCSKSFHLASGSRRNFNFSEKAKTSRTSNFLVLGDGMNNDVEILNFKLKKCHVYGLFIICILSELEH